ncbi:putative entry exclusion protein TrbK-alt [uncultured Brevundimonas sp.]|jgi:conjugative transfer region protein TrbK|uniref:putative entry exclusion protein TrbK-alt n=1 Tax=Brevundimonas diminuta TaxID=293 RepID=UPI0025F172EF|nr:putative entry exclusion protein TrbK-alt [uncultured Brevundimonas sp.]
MRALFRRDPLGVAAVIIAIGAIGAAVLASPGAPAPIPAAKPVSNAASAELARCRSLGEAGGADPDCHAAWAESRRRFFGGGDPS